MEYKVRKFQTPSGTLQYFANLNAEARGKNSSPEERVQRAFGTQGDQQRHDTPGLRTDRNGIVSVDYENQGNYVPTVTHKVGTAIGDVGTQLLHGVQTLGSSVVGDVVKGFSPNAAN
jgi:predicted Zn-dependent protease